MPHSIKIMIVEDDMIIRLDLEMAIRAKGFNLIAKASSAEEAISKAKQHDLDVILMDIGLKRGMDGIEAAKAIQEIQKVNIIFLSGNSDHLTKARMEEVEASAFIVKPVNVEELALLVQEMFLG